MFVAIESFELMPLVVENSLMILVATKKCAKFFYPINRSTQSLIDVNIRFSDFNISSV